MGPFEGTGVRRSCRLRVAADLPRFVPDPFCRITDPFSRDRPALPARLALDRARPSSPMADRRRDASGAGCRVELAAEVLGSDFGSKLVPCCDVR